MANSIIPITKSVNSFASDLLNEIQRHEKPASNIFISPLSVQTALGLLTLGATGRTFDKLLDGLKLRSTVVISDRTEAKQREALADAFHQLLAPFENNPTMQMANKIYVQKRFHIKAAFERLAREKFASDTESLDFSDSVRSATIINEWVESKTNHHITDLIASDALSDQTRLVLVNAIYFKGTWLHKFETKLTIKEPFYTSETASTNVDMMKMQEDLRFGEWPHLDATALELPYENAGISMLIVLPNKRDGLKAMIEQLKTVDIAELANAMRYKEMKVSLPKFQIEYEVRDLPRVLQKMGIENIFSKKATFDELLEEHEPLNVSDVVHKAFIEVNEEGTEASAATAYTVAYLCLSVPRHFNVNHGFQFYLMMNQSIIFAGCVSTI